MLKLYLDSNYMCHLTNSGTYRTYYTDFFDENTPEEYIEGFRLVPPNEVWTRSDGVKFNGLMVTCAVNSDGLERVKR